MEVRKGYKQTDIGIIPEDWEVTTVGSEFSIQLGKMLDAEKNIGVPKPFLGNRSVQWGRIDINDLGLIKLTPTDLQRFRLRDGDLLVCEGGEVGRAALWKQPIEECYYQKALHRLRPKRGYNTVLMINILQHLSSKGFLLNYVTQTSIAHLPKDKFETVPIIFPPLAEQEAIAEALSDADALIESLEALLAKKRQVKQGAMSELLSGKKRLTGFDGEWVEKTLGEIGEITGAGVDKKIRPNESPVRLVNYLDVYHKDFIYSEHLNHWVSAPSAQLKRCAVRTGDIFFTPSSEMPYDIAVSAVAMEDIPDAAYSYHVVRLRLNEDNDWNLAFRTYIFKTNYFLSQAETMCEGSGKRYVITLRRFRELKVYYPTDLKEQSAIAEILSDMDAEIRAVEGKLSKARAVKAGMMSALLGGRVRLV